MASTVATRVRKLVTGADLFNRSDSCPVLCFKLGALRVRVITDDAEFGRRFARIFNDCLISDFDGSPSVPPQLDLKVCSSETSSAAVAEIFDHDCNSSGAVLSASFPELDLVPARGDTELGWQFFAQTSDLSRALLAVGENQIVLDRGLPWQRIVAHYFVNHVMRLQPDYAFFHAATVAIGNCGVLLAGEKGAGKSTLSLALASRGHGFLGDELATIHSISGMILPFRRAVSIRLGPQAKAVMHYLKSNPVDKEVLPDGTERLRVPASQIFPAATGRAVELTHAFFLKEISEHSKAKAFAFSWRDMHLLAPLYATVVSMPPAVRMLRFLKLFANVRCYILSPGGTPDETAELIESIVERKWDIACSKERSA